MSQFQAPFDPKADDPKIGRIIKPGMDGDVVIIGFPYDEGCTRNGGRAGAKEAPAYFQRLLSVCGTVVNPEFGIDLNSINVSHGGNINANLPLEVAHKQLEDTVKGLLVNGKTPFVVGGGNDQCAANARALLAAELQSGRQSNGKAKVALINIDAHLDVRPPLTGGLVHSGTPFRELLEDSRFDGKNLVEFSCQGRVCSIEHSNFVEERGGRLFWLSAIRGNNQTADVAFAKMLDTFPADVKIFINFNMDSITGADCPGVSAPAAMGLSSQEALNICKIAGEHPNVAFMDISELNPVVEDYRSPRLTTFMFYYYLLGFAIKKSKNSAK